MRVADLRTAQELGGWKSLNMVRYYAHVSQEHERQAVEPLAEDSPTLSTTPAESAKTANDSKVLNKISVRP